MMINEELDERKERDILSTSRNYNLDLIKILACIAVVGLHTLQKDISNINQSLYYACGFAVPAFFMSTGYVLLKRKLVDENYCWNKIKRILQLTFRWSVLVSVAYVFVQVLRRQFTIRFLLVLPKTYFGGLIQRGILWQFWYLGALIIVYLIYPTLLKHKTEMPRIWIFSAAFSFVIQILSYFIGTPLQSYVIQTFRIWTWLQYFILGGLIGEYSKKKKMNFKYLLWAYIILTVLVVVYQNLLGKVFLHNTFAEYFYDSLLTVVWVLSFFKLILRIKLKNRTIKIVQSVAPLTMGIYIVHPLMIKFLYKFIVVDTVTKTFVFFFIVLLSTYVCVAVMEKIPFVKQLIQL